MRTDDNITLTRRTASTVGITLLFSIRNEEAKLIKFKKEKKGVMDEDIFNDLADCMKSNIRMKIDASMEVEEQLDRKIGEEGEIEKLQILINQD